jgi:hypothetical protein
MLLKAVKFCGEIGKHLNNNARVFLNLSKEIQKFYNGGLSNLEYKC